MAWIPEKQSINSSHIVLIIKTTGVVLLDVQAQLSLLLYFLFGLTSGIGTGGGHLIGDKVVRDAIGDLFPGILGHISSLFDLAINLGFVPGKGNEKIFP